MVLFTDRIHPLWYGFIILMALLSLQYGAFFSLDQEIMGQNSYTNAQVVWDWMQNKNLLFYNGNIDYLNLSQPYSWLLWLFSLPFLAFFAPKAAIVTAGVVLTSLCYVLAYFASYWMARA